MADNVCAEHAVSSSTDSPVPVSDVWQTTHLDKVIGNAPRQRVAAVTGSIQEVTSSCQNDENSEKGAGCREIIGDKQVQCCKAAIKRRRPKPPPRVVPTVRVYIGTFVHATSTEPLQILEKWMIGVDGGKIIFSQPVADYKNVIVKYKLKDFEKECVIELERGSFMMPGFVDCHTHVVPFLLAGLRSKFDQLQLAAAAAAANDCNDRRLHTHALAANDKSISNLFTSYVTLSLMNGITCAAYNGSVIESAARLLVDTVVRYKQRAVIGLEMFCGDSRDDSHIFQLIKSHDVVEHIKRKKLDRVKPCLILSKPLPDWLLQRSSALANDMDVVVKLTVGEESLDDVKCSVKEWVELGEGSLLAYYAKHGLLTNRTVLTNCSLCSQRELKLIADVGAAVVHCPSSDLLHGRFQTLANVRQYRLNVGLGTDLNTSHSVSMLDAIRTAMTCVKLGKCWPASSPRPQSSIDESSNDDQVLNERDESKHALIDDAIEHEMQSLSIIGIEKIDETIELVVDNADNYDVIDSARDGHHSADVSFRELFRMATLGGAAGIDDKIGNFQIGKEFDAIRIQPSLPRSKFVTVTNYDTVEDVVEKFLFQGDDRNIVQVYIAGEPIL